MALPEIMSPDPREKRLMIILVLVICAVAIGFGIWLKGWNQLVSQLMATQQYEEAQRQLRIVFGLVSSALSLSLFGLGALVFEPHYRAKQEGRYPHSRARVFRETEIIRGEAAQTRARRGMLAGAGLLALAFISMIWTYSLLSQ